MSRAKWQTVLKHLIQDSISGGAAGLSLGFNDYLHRELGASLKKGEEAHAENLLDLMRYVLLLQRQAAVGEEYYAERVSSSSFTVDGSTFGVKETAERARQLLLKVSAEVFEAPKQGQKSKYLPDSKVVEVFELLNQIFPEDQRIAQQHIWLQYFDWGNSDSTSRENLIQFALMHDDVGLLKMLTPMSTIKAPEVLQPASDADETGRTRIQKINSENRVRYEHELAQALDQRVDWVSSEQGLASIQYALKNFNAERPGLVRYLNQCLFPSEAQGFSEETQQIRRTKMLRTLHSLFTSQELRAYPAGALECLLGHSVAILSSDDIKDMRFGLSLQDLEAVRQLRKHIYVEGPAGMVLKDAVSSAEWYRLFQDSVRGSGKEDRMALKEDPISKTQQLMPRGGYVKLLAAMTKIHSGPEVIVKDLMLLKRRLEILIERFEKNFLNLSNKGSGFFAKPLAQSPRETLEAQLRDAQAKLVEMKEGLARLLYIKDATQLTVASARIRLLDHQPWLVGGASAQIEEKIVDLERYLASVSLMAAPFTLVGQMREQLDVFNATIAEHQAAKSGGRVSTASEPALAFATLGAAAASGSPSGLAPL